jgi:6-pyruvoyltetrahydropterin/6-carboxytetrahydropterin synthase
MYRIQTEAHFDAAHFLAGYEGKCRNLHGHRWRVLVTAQAEELVPQGPARGMVEDFTHLKQCLRGLADSFDHALIYEKGSLQEKTVQVLEDEQFRLVEVPFRPTSEGLAHYLFGQLRQSGEPVSAVTVYETPDNCATYSE